MTLCGEKFARGKLNNAFLFICVIGCCFHVCILIRAYFKYETTSTYAIYVPIGQHLPHLTMCFVPPSKSRESMTSRRGPLRNHLALRDFLSASKIDKCSARNFMTGKLDEKVCYSIFNVIKWRRIKVQHCVTLRVVDNGNYTLLESAAMMDEKNILYSLSLNFTLKKYDRIILMNHFSRWPEYELLFAKSRDIRPQDRLFPLVLSHQLFEFTRLPHPYGTDCLVKHPAACTSKKERYSYLCEKSLCHRTLTVTISSHTNSNSRNSSIAVSSLVGPVHLIKSVPVIVMSDFIVSVYTVLGLWLAFSIPNTAQEIINLLHLKYSRPIQRKFRSMKGRVHPKPNNFTVVRKGNRNQLSTKNAGVAHRFAKALMKVVVVVFFCVETYKLSYDYFRYDTRMKTTRMEQDTPFSLPSVSHCFGIQDWLNVSSPVLSFRDYDQEFIQVANQLNYTLKEIFDSIPDDDSVIQQCRIRSNASPALITEYNCAKYFNVSKFYQNEFICYLMTPQLGYSLDVTLQQYKEEPNVLYSITLQDRLAKLKYYQPIVSHGTPELSRLLANRLDMKSSHRRVTLSFLSYKYELLPPPYNTNCDRKNQLRPCRISCLNASLSGFLPYTELLTDPVNQPIIGYNQLRNHTFAERIKNAETYCAKRCRDDCETDFFKTLEESSLSSNGETEFVLSGPTSPCGIFVAMPAHTLYDYMYQVACCTYFWLGLALITILRLFIRERNSVNQEKQRKNFMQSSNSCNQRRIRRRMHVSVCVRQRKSWNLLESKQVRQFIYALILSGCFLFHSLLIAAKYFQYPTTVDTTLKFEKNSTNLKSIICITVDQLDLGNNYSLANIWEKSPREDEIIAACGHREFYLPELSHLPKILQHRILPHVNSSSLCNELLLIKKQILLGMVCYEVSVKNSSDPELEAIYHLHSTKDHHFLYVNAPMAKYNLTVMLTQTTPHVSSLYSTGVESNQGPGVKWYWISYAKYGIKSLPYPYQTNILSGFDRINCVSSCVDQNTRNLFQRLSAFGQASEPSSLDQETLEKSLFPASMDVRLKCAEICLHDRYRCLTNSHYYQTFHDGPHESIDGRELIGSTGFWIRNTDYLVSQSTVHPALRLVDLVLYIGSIYSLWFGLSALATVDFFSSLASSTVSSRIYTVHS